MDIGLQAMPCQEASWRRLVARQLYHSMTLTADKSCHWKSRDLEERAFVWLYSAEIEGGDGNFFRQTSRPTSAVRLVSRLQCRPRKTPGRLAKRYGSPGALKVGRACRFVREQSLELRQRARGRQMVSLKHVDNHDRPGLAQMFNIVPVVGLGDNRISTHQSTTCRQDNSRNSSMKNGV